MQNVPFRHQAESDEALAPGMKKNRVWKIAKEAEFWERLIQPKVLDI